MTRRGFGRVLVDDHAPAIAAAREVLKAISEPLNVEAPTMPLLTVADIEAGYAHESHGQQADSGADDDSGRGECPGWLGFGYLGGRGNVLAAVAGAPGFGEWSVGDRGRVDVEAADAAIVAQANRLKWTAHELFEWTNSRDGRHFADTALEGPDGLARAIAEWFGSGRSGYVLGRTWSR